MKKILKKVIYFLPLILIYLTIALVSIDKVLIQQREFYENHNNTPGTIEWTNGLFCGVKLSDGTTGKIYPNGYPYEPGDKYVNKIQYNWFTGIYSEAMFVIPDNVPGQGWSIFYMLLVSLPALILILYLFIIRPSIWWFKKFKE